MLEKIILAGFGGQGIMFLGKLLCTTLMNEGKHVTYIPSYGAEQRGGTANCHVVLSSKPVGSPMVEKATIVVAMNQPSYEKFKKYVQDGGLLITNKSMVELKDPPKNAVILEIPATDMASKIGDVRLANMIILGALLAKKNFTAAEKFYEQFAHFLTGKKAALIDKNKQAVEEGKQHTININK
ncbi:MAG: 2-oxoacid:acceptor oxidoreductase family protein [Planctomycetes bacterium]|nr:2-oxoacid:acceptor oxidoreductase family protein [Planctomycetota bacterium]